MEMKQIVYVICPAYHKTGGTELAHQLVYEACNRNVDARITYYNWNMYDDPINPEFREYVDRYTKIEEIEDRTNNFLLVPETNFYMLNDYKHIKKGIWWMSVDNYLKNDGFLNAARIGGVVQAIKALLRGRITFVEKGFDKEAKQFYQSEYARQFLITKGVSNVSRLSDYINDSYINSEKNVIREKLVLYNPKKGLKFTKKIIKSARDINWKAIENLTTQEVKQLLSKSMIYVDFGNHPGKDRFPREAAMSGCCIITGKNGSAKYYEDIPIPGKYKFENNEKNIDRIVNTIRDCLENFDERSMDFESYRNMIKREHENFIKDVEKFCETIRA